MRMRFPTETTWQEIEFAIKVARRGVYQNLKCENCDFPTAQNVTSRQQSTLILSICTKHNHVTQGFNGSACEFILILVIAGWEIIQTQAARRLFRRHRAVSGRSEDPLR
jgi:hypothetical protein